MANFICHVVLYPLNTTDKTLHSRCQNDTKTNYRMRSIVAQVLVHFRTTPISILAKILPKVQYSNKGIHISNQEASMLIRKIRENSHIVATLFAICLALAAQYLFTGEVFTHQLDSNTWVWTTSYSVALVMLLLAIGFATWAASLSKHGETETSSTAYLPTDELKRDRTWLIGSGVCYLLSILVYLFVGENSLVRWLWAAGIGLLIIPLWLQSRGKSTTGEKIQSWEWILVGIIALIGFGLRYWKLTEIPSHVDNDVALMGTFGLKLIGTGQYNWIGFSGSQHLLSYDQFMAWGMRLFGQNHYGIVMVSVVLGTLSLVLIFLLGRELGGRFIGFVALGLLTISYTHIQFSRILFGNSASFVAIFAIYAFFKGLRARESSWFALAGVLIGWGLLLYDSSRVIPAVVLFIMIWQWIWQREVFKSLYKNWGVLIAGIILGFGPMLAFAVRDFFNFSGRANVVTLWNPVIWQHELASYETTSPIQVLWQQTWRTFLTLHLTGDRSPHFLFQRPMVDSLTALLFILGVGYGLSRIKNIKYFSILSWIMLTFIFGGVLTSDPPYWPHLNIALPAIALVAAIGAKGLADKTAMIFGQVGYKVYAWVLASIIIITGISNWQIYYDYVKNNANNRIRIVRYLASLPPSYNVYLASPDWNWNEHAFQFFNQGMTGQDLTPEMLADNPPVIQQPTVFILFKHPELVPILQNLYPDGEKENHYDVHNQVSFISYRVVPPEYELKPADPPTNPLGSSGWLLIFGLIIYYVGYVAYSHYSSLKNAETAAVK
jgi:4-amino-4-deoxy-L-arabinose transferase-like glycosyltransferase